MDKLYYISNGQDQEGPYTVEELKEKEINKDTLIWREGLQNWMLISSVDRLGFLIKSHTPPPLPTVPPPTSISGVNNSYGKPEDIKVANYLLMLSMTIGAITTYVSLKKSEVVASQYEQIGGYIGFFVSLVITIVFIIMINNRLNWARIVFLIWFILGLFFLPFSLVLLKSMFGDASVVWAGAETVLRLIAIIFLFTQESNRWFKKNQ